METVATLKAIDGVKSVQRVVYRLTIQHTLLPQCPRPPVSYCACGVHTWELAERHLGVRQVCGGCMDFKIVTALDAGKYGDWEAAGHAPEADFLAKLTAISGVDTVETQTYTLMPM